MKKNFVGPNLGQNWARNCFFFHFLKFGSLFFLEIAYNDSFQQILTSSRGEINKKNVWDQIWAKIRPETRFFFHFLKFGSLVFLEIAYNDSFQQFLTSSRSKTYKKNFGGPNLAQNRSKLGPKLSFLSFSQVWFIIFPGNSIQW